MSEEVKEIKAEEENQPVLEINNVQELDEKLAEAIETNDNKPTDEEVEGAQKAFDEASVSFASKSWDIGETEDAQSNLDYINHFVMNRLFWTKTGWMGVLKMHEELEDAQKFLTANPTLNLKLGYQALEFMFYSFQNPGGVGLQAAHDFEQENEIYAKVFDAMGPMIADARKELKDIQFLQDQYAAMAQGFYLEVELEEPEEVENPADEVAEEVVPEPEQAQDSAQEEVANE